MGLRVLLVEDDAGVRGLLRRVLAKEGLETEVAGDGQEALLRAKATPPDVIVMDLVLPRMDGMEAIRRLKADSATATVPIFVLSGFVTEDGVRALERMGVSDVLPKSKFDVTSFVKRLHELHRQSARVKEILRPLDSPPERKTPEGSVARTPKSPPDSARIGHRLDQVAELKALPFIAAEIIEVTADAASDAALLTQTVERDQALTAQILKLANSAYYAERGRIHNLTQAITRIGFNGVRQMALAIKLLDEYRPGERKGGLDRLLFWEHNLGCAVLARGLAEAAGLSFDQQEDAFLAGLLHDVGKAILDEHFPNEMAQAVREATQKGLSLREVEEGLFGVDHVQVARRVLGRWRLPPNILEPVMGHHRSWEEIREMKAHRAVTALVWMADVLVKAAGVGESGNGVLEDIPDAMPDLFHLDPDEVLSAVESVHEKVNELTQILLLHGGTPPVCAGGLLGIGKALLYVRAPRVRVDPIETWLREEGFELSRPDAEGRLEPGGRTVVLVGDDDAAFEPLFTCGRARALALYGPNVRPETCSRLRELGVACLRRPLFLPRAAKFLSG